VCFYREPFLNNPHLSLVADYLQQLRLWIRLETISCLFDFIKFYTAKREWAVTFYKFQEILNNQMELNRICI
jgi:hypothetical protein